LSASYSGDPSASTLDLMRCMVGDTAEPFLMQDQEVVAFHSVAAGVNTSAANLLDAMAARLSFQVDTGAEGVTTRASQRAEAFRKQAERYRALAIRAGEPGVTGAASSSAGGAPVLTGCDEPAWPCQPCDPYLWPYPYGRC
jgi:hypothetical protein